MNYDKLCEELQKNRFDYIMNNNFSGGKATADADEYEPGESLCYANVYGFKRRGGAKK